MIYVRYAYRALQYRNRHSRERVPIREKGSRKVLRLSSRGVDPEFLIITFILFTIREA